MLVLPMVGGGVECVSVGFGPCFIYSQTAELYLWLNTWYGMQI